MIEDIRIELSRSEQLSFKQFLLNMVSDSENVTDNTVTASYIEDMSNACNEVKFILDMETIALMYRLGTEVFTGLINSVSNYENNLPQYIEIYKLLTTNVEVDFILKK